MPATRIAGRIAQRMPATFREIVVQRVPRRTRGIIGAMLESNLVAGAQSLAQEQGRARVRPVHHGPVHRLGGDRVARAQSGGALVGIRSIEMRENFRGRILRITEKCGGKANVVIIPGTGINEFNAAPDAVIAEAAGGGA